LSTEHTITKRAADGTLTIAELREFLAEFDGIPAQSLVDRRGVRGVLGTGSLKVKARVNFSGGIKSISVTIPGGDEQQ
jgi:hypothetical protein